MTEQHKGFETLVFEPNESRLRLDLIQAIVEKGADLLKNPRAFVGRGVGNGWISWALNIGKDEGKSITVRVVDILKMPTPNAAMLTFIGKVLYVVFDDRRVRMSLSFDEANKRCVLTVSTWVKPSHVLRLANQIVADLVVNGREREYLLAVETARRTKQRKKEIRAHNRKITSLRDWQTDNPY